MSQASDRLFTLLPVVHRQRDEESDGPLKALLSVIAEQVDIVEQDIARLYENWFIETCDDWVVPYLGDLVGYRLAPEVRERGFVDYERQGAQERVFVSRREVANTLRYRRRKGSLALLESLANDIAEWPARAVEFYRLVAANQGLKHHGMPSNYLVDLRFGDDIDRVNTPFDEIPHTVDVRRLGSHRSQGLYNPTHVGLFVWRLKPYSVSRTQARPYPVYDKNERGDRQYTFDAFGHDVSLYTLPVEEPEDAHEPTHIADESNLPVPIRRGALRNRLADYYGEGKSFYIWRQGLEKDSSKVEVKVESVEFEHIVSADLQNWSCQLEGGQVAVDPALGRLLFAEPQSAVWVSYHYGFSADIGGGEYDRPMIEVVGKTQATPANPPLYQVSSGQDLMAMLRQWERDQPAHAVIEIGTSGKFDVGALSLNLRADHCLHVRAANTMRPVIQGMFRVTVDAGSRLVLDGLLIDGSLTVKGVQDNTQAEVLIRHCTLVPGKGEDTSPSLTLTRLGEKAVIESSIVGPVRVSQHEVRTEPIQISVVDSIIDAGNDKATAVGALNHDTAHAVLSVERSTILGDVRAHAMDAAVNAIFTGLVRVERRQRGEMRFCYVPAESESHTPSLHQCQPDLAAQDVERQLQEEIGRKPTADEIETTRGLVRSRIRPGFTSRQYGDAAYCQLATSCPQEIVRGADDEGEWVFFMTSTIHNVLQT